MSSVKLRRVQWAPPASREKIARWQAELDRIAPPTPAGPSHLRIVWVPGYSWQPVERWVIYQMSPPRKDIDRDGVPDNLALLWADLNGPNPARFTRFDPNLRRVVRTRRFVIDRFQWQLFQETGCYGQPLWIIQGSRGGHKRAFDMIESRIAELNGAPSDPPRAGDLPYAELSSLTIAKLKELDLVAKYKFCIDFCYRHPQDIEADEHEKIFEMKRQLWNWLGSQVEAELDEMSRADVQFIRDNARADVREPDYEAIEHEFVHAPE